MNTDGGAISSWAFKHSLKLKENKTQTILIGHPTSGVGKLFSRWARSRNVGFKTGQGSLPGGLRALP